MLTTNNSGDISVYLPGGILGFASNSSEKWFDIWCDYFYFTITTKEPFSKENTKEYVHSYLYLVNPFGKKLTKIIYFGKFILLVELDSYASR